jgi:hypothetical protein
LRFKEKFLLFFGNVKVFREFLAKIEEDERGG